MTSIRQALCLLGEVPFRKWVTVMAMRMLGSDKPEELTVTSLVRARFCELIAGDAKLSGRQLDLFLVGILSVVDALIGQPMAQLLDELSVPGDVRNALLGKPSALTEVFALVRAYEGVDWGNVARLSESASIPLDRVSAVYCESLKWVDEIFAAA